MNAPRRISDREVSICIDGYFMPTDAPNVPTLIGMPGTDDLFIFVFSTEEKLVATMTSLGIEYARVARVTDGVELFDEIKATNESGARPYRIRFAVDAYKADNGRVRFVEPFAQEAFPMSALSTTPHAEGCQGGRESGIAVWMCVADCPALAEFIASGQVDDGVPSKEDQ